MTVLNTSRRSTTGSRLMQLAAVSALAERFYLWAHWLGRYLGWITGDEPEPPFVYDVETEMPFNTPCLTGFEHGAF